MRKRLNSRPSQAEAFYVTNGRQQSFLHFVIAGRTSQVLRISRFFPFAGSDRSGRQRLIDKATTEATTGRRLAMYDRASGLYASWYMEHRFAEEAARCKRHDRPMSALLVETSINVMAQVGSPMAEWLRRSSRTCDFAGCLPDGRYFLLMPETDAAGAEIMMGRFQEEFPRARIGMAFFPDDGETYAEIRDAAYSWLAATAND